MPRIVPVLLLSVVGLALLVPEVLAQGSRYGGGGVREPVDNDDQVVESFNGWLVLLVICVIVVVAAIVWARRGARRQARAARLRAVRSAAADAARDDPAFAPKAVQAAAAVLYRNVQRAWSTRDLDVLERMLGPELYADRRRKLKELQRRGQISEIEILEGPRVEYVGLVNREGTEEDRVTVAVRAVLMRTVRDADGASHSGGERAVDEYWTLAREAGGRIGWRVVAIEQREAGEHHLHDPIVAVPEPREPV